jgi:hypothetical protein
MASALSPRRQGLAKLSLENDTQQDSTPDLELHKH